jgi:hypothetical protein
MFCPLSSSAYEKTLLYLIEAEKMEASSMCFTAAPSVLVAYAKAVGICSMLPKRGVSTAIASSPGEAVLKFAWKRKSYGVFVSEQTLLVFPYVREYRGFPLQTVARQPLHSSPW